MNRPTLSIILDALTDWRSLGAGFLLFLVLLPVALIMFGDR